MVIERVQQKRWQCCLSWCWCCLRGSGIGVAGRAPVDGGGADSDVTESAGVASW